MHGIPNSVFLIKFIVGSLNEPGAEFVSENACPNMTSAWLKLKPEIIFDQTIIIFKKSSGRFNY